MDIMQCIQRIYPDWRGAVWSNTYEGIKPHELETRPIPSLAELEAVWPQIEAERIAAEQAEAARVAAKTQAIIDNLPSWAQVSDAIDNAFPNIAQRTVIKKLARIVYWLAKDKAE